MKQIDERLTNQPTNNILLVEKFKWKWRARIFRANIH